jgi:hypothetical protein
MHEVAGPPRAIRIRDLARPAGIRRRATLAGATAKADHPATVQAAAAITAMVAAAAIRAAAAAVITAAADLEVALAAPVQAVVVAAMATAEGMVVATLAAENADRTGIISRLSVCRTIRYFES